MSAIVRRVYLLPVSASKSFNSLTSARLAHVTNTIINFVPTQEAWIVERMGKYHKILEPGLNVLLPVVDKIKYVQSLKEIAIEIPQQGAITLDNVQMQLDGVLYLRILDPYKASYGVDDAEFAVKQLAQTTMRSEVGKMYLDELFKERERLNVYIVESINKAATEQWGISCLRYEIRDMTMPAKIQEAMQMQVEAERRKRAKILESEGERDAAINKAEGMKKARVLASEAQQEEEINVARGAAEALRLSTEAKAAALERVATALGKEDGEKAAMVKLAEEYVLAFGRLAREGNSLIVPADVADPARMIAHASSIYKSVTGTKQ